VVVELCASDTYHSIDLQCRAVVSGEYRIHRVLSEQRLRVQYKNEARNHVQVNITASLIDTLLTQCA